MINKTIFITHIPAFYQINLYNEIAKKKKIYVIFLGTKTIENRSSDFISTNENFDYSFINYGYYQNRIKLFSLFKLIKMLIILKPNEIVISGWDNIEFWSILFLFKKAKISLVLESTIIESRINGIKGVLKKFFLKRISKVYASGNNHVKLLKELSYNGKISITRGVGLINYYPKRKPIKIYQGVFLYIGRLDIVKNLKFLIECFNNNPKLKLIIVGEGPLEANLKKQVKSENIHFVGSVKNKDLSNYFSKTNYTILPSISEPWGLVTEESLYNGVPVVISKNCGSCELVKNGKNGFIFDPYLSESLNSILSNITSEIYNKQCSYIKSNFIDLKDKKQVEAYLVD